MGGFAAAAEAILASPPGAPAHPRAHLAAALPQLHVHPAVVDRLPAHHDLLPHRAQDEPVQAHRDPLPALHRWRIWLPCVFLGVMANRATDVPQIEAKLEARAGAGGARPATLTAARARRAARAGERRRRAAAAARALRAALARRPAGRRHHGGGDGHRLADPRALHDVHRGRVRPLRRAARASARRRRCTPAGPS